MINERATQREILHRMSELRVWKDYEVRASYNAGKTMMGERAKE